MLCRKGPCKYHGFLLLEEWCRHPDHLEPIKPGRACAMMAAGGKCPSFVDWEAKVMPHEEPPWPMPVDFTQLLAVIAVGLTTRNKKAVSMHHVHEIAETSTKNDARAA